MMENEAVERLEGTVEDIKFRNEQNGYTVLELGAEDELFTAVGNFADIHTGEQLRVEGVWTFHSTFGKQFKVQAYERNMPATAEQLYTYLSAGAVKGIGPSTAARILEKFGERAFDVLENAPEQLATIKGISLNRAKQMQESFRKQFAVRNVMLALETYGMSPRECIAAYDALGAGAVERIQENPFVLCETESGIGFERAETIAQALPTPPPDDYRIRAGLTHIVRRNLYANGHTCIPQEKLISIATAYLRVDRQAVCTQLETLLQANALVACPLHAQDFIFLPSAYRDEKAIADHIRVLLRFPPPQSETLEADIAAVEKADGITYAETQRAAIQTAASCGLLILTGGPGTGKTTTLNGILRLFERQGLQVALAAPTGRAAKRMTELCGHEAKTIHRLLEVEWDGKDRPVFKRNLRNPLECDALVLDELSMVDISLFASLLQAMPFGCRLVLVGDSDQLPPVGAGNVLADLIDSGLLPVVALHEVFRQAQDSLIVTNAHRIVSGEAPELSKKDGDFFFLENPNAYQAAKTVAQLYAKRLPDAYGLTPQTDIQVLCPSKKGEAGTVHLNRILQSLVNPPSKEKQEIVFGFRTFRTGDKVMQTKNNYDLPWERSDGETGMGIFNGDIGVIERINPQAQTVEIGFDDRFAVLTKEQLADLELAYAVTVHKSQGSEFPAVILPIISVLDNLKYRNLLYTAVTRAKKLLVLVGSRAEIAQMAANDKKIRRYSALKYFLETE